LKTSEKRRKYFKMNNISIVKNYNIILIILIVFLISCTENISRKIGSCYLHEDGKIKYLLKAETGETDTLVLRDANAVFFEIIQDDMHGNECVNGNIWAKDKLNVWYKNVMLPGADPKTFSVLDNAYSKDKEHAYFYDQLLVNVDINSFEVLSFFFAKDKQMVLLKGKEVFGVEDIEGFEVIDAYFSKDTTAVYFNNDTLLLKIPDSDPNSFKSFSENEDNQLSSLKYYVDKDKVYITDTDKTVGEEDFMYMFDAFIESFNILPEKYYSKDNFNVYFKNRIIENADIETFETLGKEYATDKKYVYFQNKRLVSADKESFRVFADDDSFDARDAQNYYLQGKKVREQ
jgi:hypothetical protein